MNRYVGIIWLLEMKYVMMETLMERKDASLIVHDLRLDGYAEEEVQHQKVFVKRVILNQVPLR